MIRTAIIENTVVTNVVMHDPDGDWTPPEGAVLMASETASAGDTWDGITFIKPSPTPGQMDAAIRARLESIDAKSVRPLRAILEAQTAGMTPDPVDVATLADLKTQADTLRAGLAT